MSISPCKPRFQDSNGFENIGAVLCNKEIHASTEVTPTSSSNAPCFLVDKIPPEVRNIIYELAFTTDADTQAEIDLFCAAGPSRSLLLTCRRVHDEAAALHKHLHRRYWTTTSFTATVTLNPAIPCSDGVSEVRTALAALGDGNLQHVRKLVLDRRIVNDFGTAGYVSLGRFMYDGAIWEDNCSVIRHMECYFGTFGRKGGPRFSRRSSRGIAEDRYNVARVYRRRPSLKTMILELCRVDDWEACAGPFP